jgi:hypothetical protein
VEPGPGVAFDDNNPTGPKTRRLTKDINVEGQTKAHADPNYDDEIAFLDAQLSAVPKGEKAEVQKYIAQRVAMHNERMRAANSTRIALQNRQDRLDDKETAHLDPKPIPEREEQSFKDDAKNVVAAWRKKKDVDRTALRFMDDKDGADAIADMAHTVREHNNMSTREAVDAIITATTDVGDNQMGHNGRFGAKGAMYRPLPNDITGNAVISVPIDGTPTNIHMPQRTFNKIVNLRKRVTESVAGEAGRTTQKTTEGAQRGANIRKTLGAFEPNAPGMLPETVPGMPPGGP